MTIQFPVNFEKYINAWWPKSIPEDCTKLDREGKDCLERNLSPCKSCFTYLQLVKRFSKLGRIR